MLRTQENAAQCNGEGPGEKGEGLASKTQGLDDRRADERPMGILAHTCARGLCQSSCQKEG